jgi:hypothetical protein
MIRLPHQDAVRTCVHNPKVVFVHGFTKRCDTNYDQASNRYESKIYGQPDASWLAWFGEARAHIETLVDNSQVTTFSNVIMDQAGLVGLIRRLHGLGVVLISIRQV